MPTLELTTNLLADIGGWPALKEARLLVERGRVRDARREGDFIRATVQGAEKSYEPQITLADRVANIEVKCACIESRKSGRVCAHALAAGLALLNPLKIAPAKSAPINSGPQVIPAAPSQTGPRRWLLEEAPVGTPSLELTLLLPWPLPEGLAKESVRVILEAQRPEDPQPLPWDAVLRHMGNGYAVSEADDSVLSAIQAATGTVAGINAIPRAQAGKILHALSNHPRVWLGKKERVAIHASNERPQIVLKTRADYALELTVTTPEIPSTGKSVLPGWMFDGKTLTEIPARPAGFATNIRVVPSAQIPDFLLREWPLLEQICELLFPPGFEEFSLEIGRPEFEARLDGALSGLTLELIARYGNQTFSLSPKDQTPDIYFPDGRKPNRFWRRDHATEQRALAEIDAAGFKLVRSSATTFTLPSENAVARFLANTFSRWKQKWKVVPGSRLESTLQQIDIAEPEFALRSGSGENWLSLDLKLSVHGQPIALAPAEIQRWLQTGQSHARTPGQRTLLLPTEAWGEMQEVLSECSADQQPGRLQVPRAVAPYLSSALTAQGFRAGENNVADRPAPDVKTGLDATLIAQLRPYQLHGVEWLASLSAQKLNGLLADDMGLGKTLQALAFAAWLRAQSSSKKSPPILVVCPTSLVVNWLREAARFTPHLRALDLTGSDRAKKFAAKDDRDLLVTSYAILRRDIELYRTADFSLVILDEAQHIKNRGSQNAQSAKALRAQNRLILTGTPLENSVLDLWSLYDFLLPGYLGTATEFRERYETPLTREPSPRVMERLRNRVRPFFLRRTKEEVLTELPPKLEHLALCELSNEQQEVYRAVLAQGRRDVFDNAGKAGQGRDRIAVLTTLLRLRQVCCHLDLLPAGEAKERRVWKEPSAKLDRTFELIDEAIDGGHRVLVFSQFVKALHLLRAEAARREIAFCYLDGQTTERQAEVDRFQQDAVIPLFFISLKAGGTGLNLTGADTVIHFDPWWNPAVEEQATSRAHRMGQSRRVQAYKLIAAGTVEEKIQALQARKRELFEASLGGGDAAFVDKLTGDDLEELLAD